MIDGKPTAIEFVPRDGQQGPFDGPSPMLYRVTARDETIVHVESFEEVQTDFSSHWLICEQCGVSRSLSGEMAHHLITEHEAGD